MPWHMLGTLFGAYTTEKSKSCAKKLFNNTGIFMRQGEFQKNGRRKLTGKGRWQAVQFRLTFWGLPQGGECYFYEQRE